MNIQTRKLEAIEYLITLKDERQMELIESLIRKMRSSDIVAMQKLTHDDITAMALQSEDDYANGRVTAQSELMHEMIAKYTLPKIINSPTPLRDSAATC